MEKIDVIIIKVLIIGLMVAMFATGCRNAERETRQEVIKYFYGGDGAGGRMIASWKGTKRDDSIKIQRVICELDVGWVFYDEKVSIVDLGEYEYFARYSVTFKKGDVFFVRTETFYFPLSEDLVDEVPLTVEHLKINLKDESVDKLKYETLWQGDFDAFEEVYRKHSEIRASPN